ncbi:hypothetical protein VC83_03002 [Pseudogymnoascus destructans]|uniref:Uncharacterized protein n=2 Tax=Pseudogymnoascus destructans TaxID=655981 RepID=L8GAV4_PSED2|nr:uncharacterized protein VC83_03002 [Pseudogymnoascus destructans]ELR10202.1 hypothetical protein GMDG_04595 [Pseudogymnoascus destructans 20631-21]OAF59912.1 hypothetical protein VC83_03002 [Pseudogymnoascus destructans]
MFSSSVRNVQPDYMDYSRPIATGPNDLRRSDGHGSGRAPPPATSYYPSSSITYVSNSVTSAYSPTSIMAPSDPMDRSEPIYSPNGYQKEPVSAPYGNGAAPNYGSYSNRTSPTREAGGRITPEYIITNYHGSTAVTDTALEASGRPLSGPPNTDRVHPQRRPSNRDEFDGPHQLLPRPPSGYLEQDRDLPHLPTNLVVQEQDIILTRVNERLSHCAFDFVAKYEFPIPIDSKMRPVERPEDREWTEWVYLLKRLATKRRIPARVLYNGQIKQFVTILENSLEMRHAARNQSRPLKDDRNILQLISAGIQVAKLLRDADSMCYLDQLYVATEKQIQERSHSSRYR